MKYSLFDAHCDTALKIYETKESLLNSNTHINFKKLEQFNKVTQVFALFNEGFLYFDDIIKIADYLKEHLKNSPPNLNAVLSVEGLGNTPDIELSHIDTLFEIGVRIISLTWNQDNMLCGGIQKNNEGLSRIGKKFLKKMDEKNIILDVSHISDKGFYECFENFDGKIIATHSNSRTVCPNNRNITDDQFLTIKKRGGVVGINLYPPFVSDNINASVKDVIAHIEHFLAIGGENNIGIGADFDGINTTLTDIYDVSKMNILFDELAKLNYNDEIIDKISHKNFENLLKSVKF